MGNSGLIITFYSYKGGVGRSFALANTAVLLARWGYRVLCIDFDIEAPGLHHYFANWIRKPKGGVLELINRLAKAPGADWRKFVTSLRVPGAGSRLDFIAAGDTARNYASRVHELDWKHLYDRRDLGVRLERLRDEWKRKYDFVLVDSRTGVTDIGGICTVQLPDILVLVVATNEQSLDGATEVARRAIAARGSLPFDRAKLLVVPLPSRLDLREEYALGQEWLGRLTERLSVFYQSWITRGVAPSRILQHTQIPYFSFWSFGERLPTVEERAAGPESISFHFQTFAALIAHRLARTEILAENRDYFVKIARKGAGRRPQRVTRGPDVYLSYAQTDSEFAGKLGDALHRQGVSIYQNAVAGRYADWREGLRNAFEKPVNATLYVAILAKGSPPAQLDEIYTFFRSSLDLAAHSASRFVPIIRDDAALKEMPEFLRQFSFLDARGEPVGKVAEKLKASLLVAKRKSPTWFETTAVGKAAVDRLRAVKAIPRSEFDQFRIERLPLATVVGEEKEWFRSASGKLLGVLIRDRSDNDWNWVVLAPDSDGLFRAVDIDVSIVDRLSAREKLIQTMAAMESTGSRPPTP